MNFPELHRNRRGFTLLEVLVATAVFTLFVATLMTAWTALQASAINMTAYALRQSDQMRVTDYLKRDVARATSVEIYNAGVLVTDNSLGDEIRLTIPDYYADSRAEDDVLGPRVPNTPMLNAGAVSYGAPLTVRFFVSNGALIREEAGAPRTLTDSAGNFTFSVGREVSGAIRGRVFYDQCMRGGNAGRTLRRQVDFLCAQRAQLQT